MTSQFLETAIDFATMAHKGQVRKHSNEPYINHPRRVAETVSLYTSDDFVIAGAWLHDTLEDCPEVSEDMLFRLFGERTTKIVLQLTDRKLSYGNRAARKREALERLSNADSDVQNIKLADILDNTPSIVQNDPDFAKVYLKEVKELHEVLNLGHRELHKLVGQMLDIYYFDPELKIWMKRLP